MDKGGIAGRQPAAAGKPSIPATQVERMRVAIGHVVTVGPEFLRGGVDADHMANTMVRSVRDYVEQERAAGGGEPRGEEARALQHVLTELMTCGSGYLAGRCDAACVARTMSQMVHEFGSD